MVGLIAADLKDDGEVPNPANAEIGGATGDGTRAGVPAMLTSPPIAPPIMPGYAPAPSLELTTFHAARTPSLV